MHSTMASAFFYSLFVTFSLFLLTSTAQGNITCLESIYQFGDSLSDTGNLVLVDSSAGAANPPYGETFPGYPTGRWSNGHLIIDYIAMTLDLPLLNPYLERNASFDHGVNFAIGGATALNTSFFIERNIEFLNSSSPLNVQIDWFKTYLNSTASICPTPVDYTCAVSFNTTLFMVGEIGVNDINFALLSNKSIEEIETYVPYIVEAITDAVRELISVGAGRIVVPGVFPIGCLSSYLTLFPSEDPNDYDELGCLKTYNELVLLHNTYLQQAVDSLGMEFPNVVIIYADYYTAFRSVTRNTSGFEQRLAACCGVGGLYNYNLNRTCGSLDVLACPNPEEYIIWDGGHYTQNTYYQVSQIVIPDILSQITCTSVGSAKAI